MQWMSVKGKTTDLVENEIDGPTIGCDNGYEVEYNY